MPVFSDESNDGRGRLVEEIDEREPEDDGGEVNRPNQEILVPD